MQRELDQLLALVTLARGANDEPADERDAHESALDEEQRARAHVSTLHAGIDLGSERLAHDLERALGRDPRFAGGLSPRSRLRQHDAAWSSTPRNVAMPLGA